MKLRHIVIVALFVLPVVALLAYGFGKNPHAVPSVLENKPAPRFRLPTLAGTEVSLDELLGRPVVVNFWSSWCVPCVAEHALLQEAAKRYGNKVAFVGIVYQDTEENARKYLSERGQTYPQLQDIGSKVAIDYGVSGVPESFFIDAGGTLRKKHVGVLSADDLVRELGQP